MLHLQRRILIIREKKQEVVIIGAGMAGLVAAIEAAANGARVTVIDKLGRASISTTTRSTSPYGSGNETSRAAGGGLNRFDDEEPVELLLRRHIEKGWGRIDPELIRTYLGRVGEDCRWLRDVLGLPFEGAWVKGSGPGLWSFLYKVAKQRGAGILFESKAVKLLTDDLGTVTGVRARTPKGAIDFKASAVILASGGFEGNHEMMIKYVGPEITYGAVLTGCPTNSGDGHSMALEVEAQLTNLNVCHIRTTDKFWDIGPARHLRHIYHLGLFINKDGKRFLDEGTADSDTIANVIVLQPGHTAALIFDDKARQSYPEEYQSYPRREEVIEVAQTIEELAKKIELSPVDLKNLIDEFNAAVSSGKAAELAIPKTNKAIKIDTPPFYGFHPVIPGLNHPLGGLKINNKTQVLDRENNPIKGLYAAGSIVNWSFGSTYRVGEVTSYMGSYHAGNSSGLATALVFGRLAGESAARESLQL